ncbi:dihydrofolate reductase [Propionibacterium australiense]|uniref:dihydrofolate reductase n=2 Tax=Propionibacterium australiense TaxID=119981 RepID=A0A383S8G9_9ACTN|nr:dihydrofolate reductase [Propionibacterium australiense]SYZ34258.1 dihydrofolate reductase [Propionibacterium australiense]VEH89939.1 Dihydrofolate reductase [Propionibacterium australiense]
MSATPGPRVIAIAMVAANGVIGDGKTQPFTFGEDWARFKATTLGHPLIVGHATHRAMGLLTGRTSIVISHDPASVRFPDVPPPGARGIAVAGLEEALRVAAGLDREKIFVCGGGQVYRDAMDWVAELDITHVHADADGQVTFPRIDAATWREIERVDGEQFDFVRYERVGAPRPVPEPGPGG